MRFVHCARILVLGASLLTALYDASAAEDETKTPVAPELLESRKLPLEVEQFLASPHCSLTDAQKQVLRSEYACFMCEQQGWSHCCPDSEFRTTVGRLVNTDPFAGDFLPSPDALKEIEVITGGSWVGTELEPKGDETQFGAALRYVRKVVRGRCSGSRLNNHLLEAAIAICAHATGLRDRSMSPGFAGVLINCKELRRSYRCWSGGWCPDKKERRMQATGH